MVFCYKHWVFYFFTPEKVGREWVLSGIVKGLVQLKIFRSDLKPPEHDQESFLLRAATNLFQESQD